MPKKADIFEEAEDLEKDLENHEEDDHDDDDEHDEDDSEGEGSDSGEDSDDSAGGEGEEGDERTLKHDDSDETEKEREEIRARRRIERRTRKEAQRAREENLRNDLAARDKVIEQLNARIGAIEHRGGVNEVAQIDGAIRQLGSTYVALKQQLETGTENNDGRAVADATEKMYQVRQHAEALTRQKQALIQSYQQKASNPQPDPRVVNHANQWVAKNNWYKQGSNDTDSIVVTAIDSALEREGWDPKTQEYWQELNVRVSKALPHRFTSPKPSDKLTGKPKQVVSGSSRSSSGKVAQGYNVSPERVEAMKEAGQWDDPKKRKEMIEAYKQYDRENGTGKER